MVNGKSGSICPVYGGLCRLCMTREPRSRPSSTIHGTAQPSQLSASVSSIAVLTMLVSLSPMSDLPLAFLGLFKAVQFLVVPSQFTFEQITSGRHSHSRRDTVAAVYQVIELMRTAAKPSMHPHGGSRMPQIVTSASLAPWWLALPRQNCAAACGCICGSTALVIITNDTGS